MVHQRAKIGVWTATDNGNLRGLKPHHALDPVAAVSEIDTLTVAARFGNVNDELQGRVLKRAHKDSIQMLV